MTALLSLMTFLGCWEAPSAKLCLDARRTDAGVLVKPSRGWRCSEPVILERGDQVVVYTSEAIIWEFQASAGMVLHEVVLGQAPFGTEETRPPRTDLILPGVEFEVEIRPGFQGRGSLVVPDP